MSRLAVQTYLLIFASSFALSLILAPVMKKVAKATGQVAVPKDNRWHRRVTPMLGGVGIYLATSIIWVVSALMTGWQAYGQPFLPLMLCATGIFALGLADDIFSMDPQHKLAGQIVITSILMFFGFRLGWTDFRTINLFLSIVWVVGITNAFNLLDNMDGLSAGIAFIAGAFLFLCLSMNPNNNALVGPVLFLCAVHLGALLGFLIFNFNPASIFMGDAGSLFIGFMLACMTVEGSHPNIQGGNFFRLISVIAIPILILFIPILDTGFVSLMRKLFRRPISEGGRDHSSHRMVAIGFTEKKAVLVLYAFAAASGFIAFTINWLNTGTSLVVIVLYLLFVIFFWIYLAKVKVYPGKSILSGENAGVITPVIVEITYKRRLFEVFLDFILITIAYYTAYLLRFEGTLGGNFDFFLKSLPIMIACQILCFYVLGVYRGVWENTGVRDLVVYIKSITAGTIIPMLILLLIYRFYSFSRAVFVIYWGLMLIMVSLSRLSFRLLDEEIRRGNRRGLPVLIYGAGVGGLMTLREIETNKDLGMAVVGFVDDNPRLHRRKVEGYPVFGGFEDLAGIIGKQQVKFIIVSFKQGGAEKKRDVKNLCLKMGAELQVGQMKLIIR